MFADKTLNQGECDQVSSPEIIASGALGPCIAIGIYDKSKKIGYMIHESNAKHERNIIRFLDTILSNSNQKNLKVYVAGGGLNPREKPGKNNINEDIYADRVFVEVEINKRFPKENVVIDWNDSLDAVELFLDTKTGQFQPDKKSISELNFEEE